MAKTSARSIKPPRVTAEPAPDEAPTVVNPTLEDGQEFVAVSMVRVKGGFVALKLTVEGWTVTDAEILTEGVVPRHHAEDAVRIATVTEFFAGVAEEA